MGKYFIKMKAKLVIENIRFERGQDPRHAMDIGQSHDPEVIEFFEQFVKRGTKDIHHDYITVQEDDLRRMLIYWPTISDDEKKRTVVFSDKHSGDSINVLDNKWVRYKGKKWFLSTNMKDLDESVNFERGLDPKDSMGIGIKAKLERYSMKSVDEYYGMSSSAVKLIKKFLKEKSASKIYNLGVIIPDQPEDSSSEEIIDDIEVIIKSGYRLPGEQSGIIGYETPSGVIVSEDLSGDGIYYWGLIPLAVQLKLWEDDPPAKEW